MSEKLQAKIVMDDEHPLSIKKFIEGLKEIEKERVENKLNQEQVDLKIAEFIESWKENTDEKEMTENPTATE